MHACTHTHTHSHLHTRARAYVCVYVLMHDYIFLSKCRYICTYMNGYSIYGSINNVKRVIQSLEKYSWYLLKISSTSKLEHRENMKHLLVSKN